ncbi:hypothetical protein SR914_10055 [Comamonas testosteroni]|jgi:hypothetical protein|uniref:Uncharacterized protein n=2 Tax=Comamonas testosteroni TaxID=285 RepID=B7WS52_COMTK|nr:MULTISPECIES: hypothetical protein [Comamonas]AIJ49220.1 hypothetical protein O987_25750 [Comamonas testosteroni TK102]EED65310.1 hypothetical protein CtesDRAFT_PD0256 [Comamonas testosteroni KF-1]MPS89179.1 hypothetical protein [Comamonas sp.]WQG68720.1 hypothetical protein SR914_10055 [Comamonas testosteroni]
MDFLTLAIIVTTVLYVLKKQEQRQHTQLLAQHLARFQIEKLMANLMEGYLRVIGEKDAQRREQIWPVLANTESSLVSQFQRFAEEFATLPAEQTRASTLPLALPYMTRVLPSATMDVREAMKLHAKALAAARVGDAADEEERKRRAFTMTAELMLMQHTCHWFCRSRTVASMRLLARHKTAYEQVLQSVAPGTLKAYEKLMQASN